MPDQTLAQRVRAKYPGVYDDLSDQQLEAKVSAKFPGAYDDVPRTPVSAGDAGMTGAMVTDTHTGTTTFVEGEDADTPRKGLEAAVRTLWDSVAGFIPGTAASKRLGQAIASGEFFKSIPREMALEAFRADKARQHGDYLTAARHLLASVIPGLGPALSRQADKLRAGKVWEAGGEMAGTALSFAAPGGAAKAVGAVRRVPARVAGTLGSLNPVEADAVRFGMAEGVPLDLATASGSRAVRRLQEVSDSTIANTLARTGERSAVQQGEAMTSLGRRLASRANAAEKGQTGRPMTPETGGQALTERTVAVVRDEHARASRAYGRLRAIEERPEHQVEVSVQTEKAAEKAARAIDEGDQGAAVAEAMVPDRFAARGAGADEIFEGVYQDAKRRGYRGTKQDLRQKFDDISARAYDDAVDLDHAQQDYSPKALFEAIRDAGGIGQDAVYSGEIGRLWESSTGTVVPRGFTKSGGLRHTRMLPTGGFGGVTNVLRKRGGKSLDTIAETLSQDPRFAGIDGPNVLLDTLDDAIASLSHGAKRRAAGGVDPEDALYFQGVRPGSQWWKEAEDASFDVQALEAGAAAAPAQTVKMALPVDMRGIKQALEPVLQRWLQTMPQTQREASPGLLAVRNIVEGPDHVPASVADANLSMLKGLSRGAATPELRDVSQGLAAGAVKQLHAAIDAAVSKAGPEALAALHEGRAATVAKYRAGEVLESLGGGREPVQAFARATMARDAGIARLREVAKIAPQELRDVGRAYLDDLIDVATKEGGFGRAKGLQAKWQTLGPETKKLLFGSEAYIEDLDRFFLLAKRMEAMANPSGTSHVATVGATSALVFTHPVAGLVVNGGSMVLSRLLHSPQATRLLVRGLSAGPKSVTATVTARQLAALMARSPALPAGALAAKYPVADRRASGSEETRR